MRSFRLALLLILAVFLFPMANATAPARGINSTWARMFTGTSTEGFTAASVQQTRDGGFIVAGDTVSPQLRGQTWLLRLDPNGGIIWQKAYGGFSQFSIGPHGPKAIETTDGGFAVAAITNVTLSAFAALIFKVDGNGGLVWQRAFTGVGDAGATSIVPAPDGGFLVFGSTTATAGSIKAFGLKLDANGGLEWQRIYTGPGAITAVFSASRTSDGGSIVSGWTETVSINAWLLKLDANGAMVWQNTYPGTIAINSVQQTSDGGFVGTGVNVVLRFDSAGSLIWQKSIAGGATRAGFFSSIQQTPDGGFALAGFSGAYPYPTTTSLIIQLDLLGNIVWQENFAAGVESQALFINLTSNGGLVAAGFDFSTKSISDAWVLKLDSEGVIHHCAPLSASTLVANEASSSQVSVTGSSSDINTGLITTTFASTITAAGSLALCQHGPKA